MQYIHLIYLQLCPNVSIVIGGMHDDNDITAAAMKTAVMLDARKTLLT